MESRFNGFQKFYGWPTIFFDSFNVCTLKWQYDINVQMKEICYRIKDFLVEFFSRLLEWDKKELFLLLIENLKNLNLFLKDIPFFIISQHVWIFKNSNSLKKKRINLYINDSIFINRKNNWIWKKKIIKSH